MKRFLTLVLVLLVSVAVALPEEHEVPGPATNSPPSLWSYRVSELVMSKYFGTIFGGTFYPGPMSFGDFAASHKDRYGQLTFDVSIGQKLDRLDKSNADGGNEYDFTVDHTLKLGPFNIDAGACYLAVHKLQLLRDDFFEEFGRVDYPIKLNDKAMLVDVYAEAFHYHVLAGGLRNKGFITYGGIIRDQSLGFRWLGNDAMLEFEYRMCGNAGVLGSKEGIEYHRFSVMAPFHWGKWTVAPTGYFQTPGGLARTYVHSKSEAFGTIAVSHSF